MSLLPGEWLEPLLTEDQILTRVKDLAAQIRADYGDEDVLLVGVLKGSYLFLADLARNLGLNASIEFVQVSSYHDQKSTSGVVQIRKDVDTTMEGKHVLIVEDIVDTGLTLKHLKELFEVRRPRSLEVCSLLRKPEAIEHDALVKYVGFDIPSAFVVGYGLDYGERFRTLPYIAVLHES
ncbi:MAG: hypoxanthine phosphoribosyltransferase [Chthonomonas sp.]|nr:hypoxanthine phosphoribosyltransferase [Chthonomonas sp.]